VLDSEQRFNSTWGGISLRSFLVLLSLRGLPRERVVVYFRV